jgi:FAD/FMN-containing dehydrogenase
VELIEPTDAGYDRLRVVFDGRVEARPAAIARCAARADVEEALALASERGWDVTVRGGGTSAAAVRDGALVLDLSGMNGVAVDPGARTARAGGGTTWAQLDAATAEHGLAAPGARVSSLGVAGTALGAGSGWLQRPLGPTGDAVRSADRVGAPAGESAPAPAGESAPAPTGESAPAPTHESAPAPTGASAPAVIVELELALHPVGPELLCGFLGFPRERAADIARAYRDAMAEAPPEVGGGLLLHAGRGGACQIVWCFAGDAADGERALAPLRALRPSLDAVGMNEYRAFQAAYDLHHPFGMRADWRSGTIGAPSEHVLDSALEAASAPASALSFLLLRPLRDGWAYDCLGLWPPLPDLDAGNEAWVDRVVTALA